MKIAIDKVGIRLTHNYIKKERGRKNSCLYKSLEILFIMPNIIISNT